MLDVATTATRGSAAATTCCAHPASRVGRDGRLSWRQVEGPGLTKTKNAWSSRRAGAEDTENTGRALLNKVNGILNKLTFEKFDSLLEKFLMLPIDSPELLRSTINLIFDKATSEEKFCPLYSQLCKQLTHKFSEEAVQTMEKFNIDGKKASFRRLLLNQCQDSREGAQLLEHKNLSESR